MLLILYTLQNIHSTWISSNVSAALVLALFHEEAKKKKSIFWKLIAYLLRTTSCKNLSNLIPDRF